MLAGTAVALDHRHGTARCTFSSRRGNPVVERAETKDVFYLASRHWRRSSLLFPLQLDSQHFLGFPSEEIGNGIGAAI